MLGELAALGAALSWTVSAALYTKALVSTKPISANIVRLAFTSVTLIVLMAVFGRAWVLVDLSLQAFAMACVSGIVGLGFGDTLYMKSLEIVGVARAVPITCTYPLFNLLWAFFLANEKITILVLFGVLAIVSGIWLLSSRKTEIDAGISQKRILIGVVSALLTAVLWSLSITMINMAVKETPDLEHALAINVIRVTAIAVSFLALSPIIDRDRGFLKMERKTFALLAFGGLITLGLGWFFLTYSFTEIAEARA